jgi:membrane associated rhomboid family serine protease
MIKKNITTSLIVVGILWFVFFIDTLIPADLRNYGIRPRTLYGLLGILESPFLHANLGHLISNSIPMFILTLTMLSFYKEIWVKVTVFIVVLGGFGVWALTFRTGTNHIGASGLIFGYISFLIFSGIFRMKFKALLVGIAIFFLYGGTMIFGVLPTNPQVSWEGHLYGAIAGIITAWTYRNINKAEKVSA